MLPFDAAIGRPDGVRAAHRAQHPGDPARRVAAWPASLDPAGGSWYVESLTDALAERRGTVFTDIEARRRGAGRASTTARSAQLHRDRPARGVRTTSRTADAPITGVSEFALVSEEPLSPADRRRSAAADGPLPRRTAGPSAFEALRDRGRRRARAPARLPRRPRPVRGAHSARVGFAANLFQAGGIEVVVRGRSARSSPPPDRSVACLCSSDDAVRRAGRGRGRGAARRRRHAGLAGRARGRRRRATARSSPGSTPWPCSHAAFDHWGWAGERDPRLHRRHPAR